ncbi:MAG TPA: NAD(P)H-quinone oxidoreductase [Gemmatimonadaceae bacterium]|nr:NAD(P)H-quinone oxidoreductase [Gemmatimonadaceae bacterium]
MRAAVITRSGGPEVLETVDVPRPLPRDGEVLVRVRTSALNRADLMQRQGRYPAPPGAPANIPGLEIAGEVAELGGGVRRWKVGDRVFGIVGGGGNAEYVVTHERELAAVPGALSWEDAAAVPEAFMTAHDALVTLAAMKPGESVLVHAVGSGVGLAAVQLVRALKGVCYGTARTADKLERAQALGMRAGALVQSDPAVLSGFVHHWTDGKGIDVTLDLVGGPYMPVNVECSAPLGRIILIGLLAGRAAQVNLGTLLTRRITIRGTVMRSRSAREKAAATEAFERDVVPLLESGEVRPIVDKIFPLERIGEAHALMESNATFGKIVLTV